jgi:hypothetical protein
VNGATRKLKCAITFLVCTFIAGVAAIVAATAPVGICVHIWRYGAIDSLVGPNSDRSHPVTWVLPCLMILSFLLTFPGAITFYMILIHLVPWFDPTVYSPARPDQRLRWKVLRWERRCAVAWGRHVRAELRGIEGARKPTLIDEGLSP